MCNLTLNKRPPSSYRNFLAPKLLLKDLRYFYCETLTLFSQQVFQSTERIPQNIPRRRIPDILPRYHANNTWNNAICRNLIFHIRNLKIIISLIHGCPRDPSGTAPCFWCLCRNLRTDLKLPP